MDLAWHRITCPLDPLLRRGSCLSFSGGHGWHHLEAGASHTQMKEGAVGFMLE